MIGVSSGCSRDISRIEHTPNRAGRRDITMKDRDVTVPMNGSRTGERRGGDRRARNERGESRRMIDCGGVVDGWPESSARSAKSGSDKRSTDRTPHGAGVYPEQHQAI